MKLPFFLPLLLLSSCHAMSMPSTTNKVAVIGSTGRLGQEVVQQLVDRNIAANVLVRTMPSSSQQAPTEITKGSSKAEVAAHLASLPGITLVKGDVSSPDSLKTLFEGCSACLAVHGATRRSKISDLWARNVADEDPSHAKQINYKGTQNIIDAAASSKMKRIVRITGKGENPTGVFSILINMLGSMAKAWNYEGERLLRSQSNIDYTIIRPGIMVEENPDNSKLVLGDDGADLKVAPIGYSSIASLCIDCLEFPNAGRATLVAMTTTTTTEGDTSFPPLLAKVQPDRRVFPDDMFDQSMAAVQKTVKILLASGVVLLTIIAQQLASAMS